MGPGGTISGRQGQSGNFPVLKLNPSHVDFIKKCIPDMIGRFSPSRARKALFLSLGGNAPERGFSREAPYRPDRD